MAGAGTGQQERHKCLRKGRGGASDPVQTTSGPCVLEEPWPIKVRSRERTTGLGEVHFNLVMVSRPKGGQVKFCSKSYCRLLMARDSGLLRGDASGVYLSS